MNKAELISAIASNADVSEAAAKRALDATLTAVAAELMAGGSVQLTGFGSFSVNERSARTGRNPQTGKPIEIAASRVPVFKAGKTLKDSVN